MYSSYHYVICEFLICFVCWIFVRFFLRLSCIWSVIVLFMYFMFNSMFNVVIDVLIIVDTGLQLVFTGNCIYLIVCLYISWSIQCIQVIIMLFVKISFICVLNFCSSLFTIFKYLECHCLFYVFMFYPMFNVVIDVLIFVDIGLFMHIQWLLECVYPTLFGWVGSPPNVWLTENLHPVQTIVYQANLRLTDNKLLSIHSPSTLFSHYSHLLSR